MYYDTSSKQSGALTRQLLLRIIATMDLSDTVQLIEAALYMICHDGLLRVAELLGVLK